VITLWLFAMGGCALATRRQPAHESKRRPAGLPTRAAVAFAFILASLTPATIALSQVRLDKSVTAFERGDCGPAGHWARSSRSLLSVRPESHAILAYCLVRQGNAREAVAEMQRAVDRDPRSWEYLYGLALVQAAAGVDPRPTARAARRLNPLEQLTEYAVEQLDTDNPRLWRRRAAMARLPLPSRQDGSPTP
jgi:hypothetical protein